MVCLFSLGCANLQLKHSTVNQASTLTLMQYQQILDNLAITASNPSALPWHANINTGTAQVTDNGSAAFGMAFGLSDGYRLRTYSPSFNAQRTIVETWGMVPVSDDNNLKLLRKAYHNAFGANETLANDKGFADDLAHEIVQQTVVNTGLGEAQGNYFASGMAQEVRRHPENTQLTFGAVYSNFNSTTITPEDDCYDCEVDEPTPAELEVHFSGAEVNNGNRQIKVAKETRITWVNDSNRPIQVTIGNAPGISIAPRQRSEPIDLSTGQIHQTKYSVALHGFVALQLVDEPTGSKYLADVGVQVIPLGGIHSDSLPRLGNDTTRVEFVNAGQAVLTLSAAGIAGLPQSLQPGGRTPLISRRFSPAIAPGTVVGPNIDTREVYEGTISVEHGEYCKTKQEPSKIVEISIYEGGVAPATAVADVGDYLVWVNYSDYNCRVDSSFADYVIKESIPPPRGQDSSPRRSKPIQLLTTSAAAGYAGGFRFGVTLTPVLPVRDGQSRRTLDVNVIVNSKTFRSPVVNEACRQLRDVNKELKEIPSGWFGVGRKHDVPHNACYVGHCGKCYTWVSPENVESLTKFALSIAKLSTVIKERQVITSPGVQYSPGFSFAPR